LDDIETVQAHTAGLDAEDFAATTVVLDAVLYRISVIGEAANAIPPEVRAQHPEIPWRAIRGMRNRLVHEYFGVRVETVWETVKTDLPALAGQLHELLRKGGEE